MNSASGWLEPADLATRRTRLADYIKKQRGWGDGMGHAPLPKHHGPEFQYPASTVKPGAAVCTVTPAPWGGAEWVPGDRWLAHLAKTASSGFQGRP